MQENNLSEKAFLQQAIAEEQDFIDEAYTALDRDESYYKNRLGQVREAGGQGTPAGRRERDSFATHYEDNLQMLRNVENNLVLGRLDFADKVLHIGRTTLRDAEQNIILTDWRAPQSEAFYQATATHPQGVRRRRHIQSRFRKVIGVEDELLDSDFADSAGMNLTGEGALFAAMRRARSGKMGDIVATIQKEQDQIIRTDAAGILVVQGGPGTGKTAVALHRAAYLLYTYRKELASSGVLVIGPSSDFLRYINQVIPSLGESNVVSTTIDNLLPFVRVSATEPAAVAAIKEKTIWAHIARQAVRLILQKPLKDPAPLRIAGKNIALLPSDVQEAQIRARRSGKTHNQARDTYARFLVSVLSKRLAAELKTNVTADEWIINDIASNPEIRRLINRHWLPASPQWLLEHMYKWPEVLALAAPQLSARERQLLRRQPGNGFTSADIPILDELAEYLGPFYTPEERYQQALETQKAADFSAYVQETMDSLQLGGGIVSSDMLQERIEQVGGRTSMAERAANDRTWTYGHIVVDEAQELSPMQWRMLARRNPRRSMTIVGDLDQRTAGSPHSWENVLKELGGKYQVKPLTISYRTPRSLLERAARAMAALGKPVQPMQAVRDRENCYYSQKISPAELEKTAVQILEAELRALDSEYGKNIGTIAVLTPAAQVEKWHKLFTSAPELAEWYSANSPEIGQRIKVSSAHEVKGLEFDTVILLEPTQIGKEGLGDFYVALTRATHRMCTLSTEALPPGLV